MNRRYLLPLLALPFAGIPWACAASNAGGGTSGEGAGAAGAAGGAAGATGQGGAGGSLWDDDGGLLVMDASSEEPPITEDAACAAVASEATAEFLPVDIIWVVDNSSSMAPAITQITQGLNAFATLIASKSLDYKVIMLALKNKTSPVLISGSTRYPVCIPPPLAGDDNCGNGARFFQSSIDIRSTQPLEQFLGTLGQTAGYSLGEARGGEPWKQELRPQATKTIVVVTDDNARLSATDFQHFAGGQNPFNSLTLPPGILDPSWGGIFDGFLFSGIYGWGSAVDPSVTCLFPDMTKPASAGPTYTTLVQSTGGVRAKICDGAAAWQPFFDAIAQAVTETAKLSCELTIPTPPNGTIDPNLVNVGLVSQGQTTYVPKVKDAAACAAGAGFYYDDPISPTKVTLCKTSCDQAQAMVGPNKPGKIEVLFGCTSIIN